MKKRRLMNQRMQFHNHAHASCVCALVHTDTYTDHRRKYFLGVCVCVRACRDKREIKTKLHRIEKQKRREEKIVCFRTRACVRTTQGHSKSIAENSKSTGLCTFAPNASLFNTHTHTNTFVYVNVCKQAPCLPPSHALADCTRR